MKDWVVAEIAVVPLGTADTSLSRYVAACIDTLAKASGIEYELTGMGTIVEGPLKKVMEMAELMHETPFKMGVERVLTSIKLDDRRDKPVTRHTKKASVQRASEDKETVPPPSVVAGLP